MSSLDYDLPIDESGNFTHAVVGRAIELKRLASCCVIESDNIEGFANINGLDKSASATLRAWLTYVNGVESFLHMVDGEHVCHASQSVE